MSVVNQTRTKAELALIERGQTSVATDAQRRALDVLASEGLPSRRVEAWHYTDLRVLLGRQAEAGSEASGATFLSPFLPHSTVVELGSAGAGNDPAPGVSVSQASNPAAFDEVVNHLDRAVDTIRLLNTAMGAAGSALCLTKTDGVEGVMELRPQPAAGGSHSYSSVDVGAGARATVVERAPAGAAGDLSSAVHHLDIGDGAEALWIVVQEKGAAETHLGQLNVRLGADAKLKLFVLNAGGAVVRQEVHAVTVGEGADIQIRGVNLLEAGQHIDVTTTLNHNVAQTTSTEIFRNVVFGGHGVFQGMIRVAKGAQKTDARLACNTLLLSDEGDFSAKPELEIFADDVQCGHGATAGEINADHLFYLMSRGIPEAPARALLVKAFVDEVVEDLEDEAVVEALETRIDDWLARDR
ncbi:Fe-S cluster assembly protein SufD [Aureimonas phyllosphaerae]|uniref:Fe-S cluster assembly protein SufD n=1 Tax=Aureimonas phyllosphaerae TaxID=1166078 RepID=A0A7W6FTP5_9HYPH|nr:Fe-S cluster assembly protein SufD [Aureimonas phyllosphaerae]MBB3935384.1 Fe-S cluster assembly protein SufD [Aureimonas phyllosphaerae]MBB3959392.1 Fe-S cluster assembly protein SufD [Aureimonas phyllosphaerae]SFF03678.1 Iron-regulated ABC transporter permease protein SufD [Aureimonas phyllosphaerae]